MALLYDIFYIIPKRDYFRVTSEKNDALLRNAEISQQMEIVKQNMRRQECEMNDLLNRVSQIEEENKKYKDKESKGIEQQLRNCISELEDQLLEKNKVHYWQISHLIVKFKI